MKKIIKNISRVLFSLLLIVSIFGALTVHAADVIFQITGISVKEKSDKVTVNDVSLSGGSINNDIVFTDQGDYITYDITIKNVTEDDYTIKSITDDNTSSYLDYTYDDLSNVKLNKGESKTFELTITYKQETSDLTITDKAVSLTLTYEKEDGTTGTETITNDDNNGTTTTDDTNTTGEVKGATVTNPKTGDNITIYIVLGLISLTGLVITSVSKKHISKSLMAIALVSSIAIPLGVKADSDKFKVSFSTNKIQNSYGELISGSEFNLKVHKLSNGDDNLSNMCMDMDNTSLCYVLDSNNNPSMNMNILSIKKASLEDYNNIKDSLTTANIVSNENSTVPVYVWFTEDTLYFYSHSHKIFMNEDSSNMFSFLTSLQNINLDIFDLSNVTDMSFMFVYNLSLKKIDFSNSNTNKLELFNVPFMGCSSLEEINFGDNFNTSKITTMDSLFAELSSLKELNLSSFDTSNVTSMAGMFINCTSLENLNISNFNTNKVTDMGSMFSNAKSLQELDLSSFDTNNVTYMAYMFSECDSLETIYVSEDFVTTNVDISTLERRDHIFSGSYNIVGGQGTSYIDSSIDYAHIDGGTSNPGYFTLKQN